MGSEWPQDRYSTLISNSCLLLRRNGKMTIYFDWLKQYHRRNWTVYQTDIGSGVIHYKHHKNVFWQIHNFQKSSSGPPYT